MSAGNVSVGGRPAVARLVPKPDPEPDEDGPPAEWIAHKRAQAVQLGLDPDQREQKYRRDWADWPEPVRDRFRRKFQKEN